MKLKPRIVFFLLALCLTFSCSSADAVVATVEQDLVKCILSTASKKHLKN